MLRLILSILAVVSLAACAPVNADPTQVNEKVQFIPEKHRDEIGIRDGKLTFTNAYAGMDAKQGTVRIWNGYSTPKTVKIWTSGPTEYSIPKAEVKDWGKPPADITDWIVISDPMLTLAPFSLTEVHISLKLPPGGDAVNGLPARWQTQVKVFDADKLGGSYEAGQAVRVFVVMRER